MDNQTKFPGNGVPPSTRHERQGQPFHGTELRGLQNVTDNSSIAVRAGFNRPGENSTVRKQEQSGTGGTRGGE